MANTTPFDGRNIASNAVVIGQRGNGGVLSSVLLAEDEILVGSANGGVPTAQTLGRVGARITNSADQSIADSTNTTLSFDTAEFDTDGMYSGGSPTRLTIQTAGIWLFGASVGWAASTVNARQIFIQANGATPLAALFVPAPQLTGASQLTLSGCAMLAASAFLEVLVFQNTGGALSILTGSDWTPVLWAVRVG